MQVLIKGSAKEIAALVLELQRQQCENADLVRIPLTESGIKLCADNSFEHQQFSGLDNEA